MLISFFYLTLIEKNQRDLDLNKNWWAVYFEDAKSNSLDFTIENHSNESFFKWEIYLEKSKTYEGSSELLKGEKKTIPISTSNLSEKKVTVKVFTTEKTQEIYKVITNK